MYIKNMMRNYSILFIVLLVANFIYGIELETGYIYEKVANVLGVELSYGLMDLEFDEKLYRMKGVACANYNCPAVTLDCSCDYTNPDKCGVPASEGCTNTCPQIYFPIQNDTDLQFPYCDTSSPWDKIEANKQYNYSISDYSTLALRYKANATICESLAIYLYPSQGAVVMSASSRPVGPGFGRTSQTTDTNYMFQLNLCPTDVQILPTSWTQDTFFIFIVPQTPLAEFVIEIVSNPTPSTVVVNNCVNVDAEHQCVNDGELISGYGGDEEYSFYTFEVTPGNKIISFSVPSLDQDVDFFVSDDPSLTKPTSADSQTKWICSNEFDDYLTISLNPSEPLILYFGVAPFYASNFSFTVTTQNKIELVDITSFSPKAGAFSIVGTSRLLLPNDTYICTVWSRCSPFSIQYPFTQNLPIWPVPAEFLSDQRFFGITYTPIDNTGQEGAYKLAFLLSSKQDDQQTVNLDFATLLTAKIQFLNNLVDINGVGLNGTYGFTSKTLTCNYQNFLTLISDLNAIENTLFSTTDFIDMNSVVFKINTLTLTDEWISCSNAASNMLASTTQPQPTLTTYCPYLSSDPEYEKDPCCNSSLTFFSCCVARTLNISEIVYNGVNDDLVSSCSSPECTTSVLNDYKTSLLTTSECGVPAYVQEGSQLEMRQVLRDCKATLGFVHCDSDSDCDGYTCDLYSRSCLVPAVEQDKAYLQCVFDNLPKTYAFSLIYKYNLNSTSDPNFIQNALNTFNMSDCTYYTGQYYRTYYTYSIPNMDPNRCYPSPRCLDLSCETVHDVCYDGNYVGFETVANSYAPICDELGFCNSKVCEGNTTAECKADCLANGNFCGYCSTNFTDCYNFNAAVSQTTCEATNYCLLPQGEFVTGLTEAQCEQKGSCDQPCGKECTGFVGCSVTQLSTQALCTAAGTGYSWQSGLCRYTTATTKTACTAKSNSTQTYSWLDCTSLAFSACYLAPKGTNLCSVQDIECTSQEACENIGGQCSDSYFFDPEIVNFYPDQFGKCTRGHYIYKSFWPIPTCDADSEKDSPVGCYPYEFSDAPLSADACRNQGSDFKWWTPAITEAACTQQLGCQILDQNINNLPYNFRFNQMNDSQCVVCGPDVFATYEPLFQWTPGVWSPGVLVKGQYRASEYINSTQLQTLLDYEKLYSELEDSVSIHIADLYRSESLCRMERLEDNLKTISCSCAGQGGSACFTTSSIVLGETKPCQGESSDYEFTNGLIKFGADSVVFACTSVLVSQIPQQLYKSTEPQSLSSSFVSYRKPDDYAVHNTKDAIIGTILADGVKISSQGVTSLTLCFTRTSDYDTESNKYPVFDFAIEQEANATLTPLELTITSYVQNNTEGLQISYLCGLVLITDSAQSIFPIHRVEKWAQAPKEVFDQTSKGLIYTLAVFFLLVAIWGFFQVGVVVFKRYSKLEKIKLVHLLIIFVTLFITIRAIYFFILPSGALSNNSVADYILVVLPTFMYFTSFTIIIVLWYIIVKTKETGRNMISRLTGFILAINAILYILFITIVLVFHFTESSPPDNCGGRIVVNVSNTTPQRTVSIVYAVIQAVISLIIGAAFIYLGGTLYVAMRFKKVAESTNTHEKQQKKIFVITFACSIGFILHCVFVLILVGAEPSNVVFSFLGLIITEIAPSLSIFYSYNQGSFKGLKQTTPMTQLTYLSNDRETFSSSKTP